MRTRTARETTVICVAAVAAIGILSILFDQYKSNGDYLVWIVFFGVIGLGMALCYQYLIGKKRAQAELTDNEQYRQLAEEYRRIADMATTAQEHTDLKLGEISAQLDYLREQMASLQKILKDVE